MAEVRHISTWFDRTPDERRFSCLKGKADCDVAIIGGGLLGVLTAWYLAGKGKKIVLIEKNRLATGDTGATTGFLTRVPDTSLARLEKTHGREFVRQVFEAARAAQRGIISLINERNIECGLSHCFSFFGSYQQGDAILAREWETARQIVPDAEFTRGVEAKPFGEAIRFGHEAKYDARRFLFGLLAQAPSNLAVFEETEATGFEVTADGVTVSTPDGSIRAGRIVLATGEPMPCVSELKPLVTPYVAYALAARYEGAAPLGNDVYWDTLDPYFFYRKIDDRTIIAGGCDAPFNQADAGTAQAKLEAFVNERLPGTHETVNRWSGSIFHSADGLPLAFAHPHYGGKVLAGLGLAGNGMVMGALAARTLAELASGETAPAARLLSLDRIGAKIAKPAAVSTVPERLAWTPFRKTSEFGKANMACAVLRGRPYAVFRIDDAYHAIANSCTHQGGSLCEGSLEGRVIECPLHGAQFDVTTGAVIGPPASRPIRVFKTRIVSDTIEIEVPSGSQVSSVKGQVSPDGIGGWKHLILFMLGATAFWILQFLYQRFGLDAPDVKVAFLRASALSGATCIGAALSLSAVFKWVPRWSSHWRLRRWLGVTGWTFVFLHVLTVVGFYYDFNVKAVYWSFNPLKNPVVFGSIAFGLFFLMAATSTDWAVAKLGMKRWKLLHRVSYFAWWAAIFHFLLVNPILLKNLAGYLLLGVAAFSVFGQFYWWIRISSKRKFKTVGAIVGAIVILMYIVTAWLAYVLD
jgi:glycine/D-amino acid oxidase-like deaminating enzyme/nitrite reductase/ring-hydroxylating ferredoxin subunit/DMSO/TMAO reductase YedYZ heme-binding membrane subunit